MIKKNGSDREEAMNAPVDGYELFMQFIVQQYRRGLRVSAGRDSHQRWGVRWEELGSVMEGTMGGTRVSDGGYDGGTRISNGGYNGRK